MEKTAQKKSLYFIALLSTLLSIGVFLYLNKHHLDLKLGLDGGQSICNVSEKLNCDIAAASVFSEVFGVPIALLGAFASGLVLVFMLLGSYGLTENTPRTERYTFYLSSFMLVISLLMAGISAFVLQSACPFCIATYVLTLITWLCLLMVYKPDWRLFSSDLADAFTTEKWVVGTFLSIPVLGFLINNMVLDSYGYQQIKQMSQDSLSSWNSAPAQTFDIENGLQYQNGNGEAKVVIVEFADFMCPHCKVAAPNLHNFAKAHPDVKIVFKSFPLDGTCNAAIQHKGDGKRCDYAYATFCSESLAKKGWDAHNYFFARQDLLPAGNVDQILEGFSKASGVDLAQLKSCMNSEEMHARVKRMTSEGEKAQIMGTPAIFFNSKVLNGGQLPPVLESIYKSFSK